MNTLLGSENRGACHGSRLKGYPNLSLRNAAALYGRNRLLNLITVGGTLLPLLRVDPQLF